MPLRPPLRRRRAAVATLAAAFVAWAACGRDRSAAPGAWALPLGGGLGPRAGGAAVTRRNPRGRPGAGVARRASSVPTQAETTKGLIEAINQSPVPVPRPDDAIGTFLFTFVGPVGLALLLVFLLFVFNPELVLGKEQMKDYNEAELAIEKKRRGVVEPARQSRGSRRRQKRKQQYDA